MMRSAMDKQLKTGKFDVTKYEQMARKLRIKEHDSVTKKKKDTYYIYYSLKTLKLFCCKRELVYSIVLYLSHALIYISAKNLTTKRVLALCTTSRSNSLKILSFPAH